VLGANELHLRVCGEGGDASRWKETTGRCEPALTLPCAVSIRTSERRMKDSPSATPRASFCSTGCSRVRRGGTQGEGGKREGPRTWEGMGGESDAPAVET
jgi:hypothetical protein